MSYNLRGCFSLKIMIIQHHIRENILFELFDALSTSYQHMRVWFGGQTLVCSSNLDETTKLKMLQR